MLLSVDIRVQQLVGSGNKIGNAMRFEEQEGTKLRQGEEEEWTQVAPAGGGAAQAQPIVSIRRNAIAFSARFVLQAKLHEMKGVRLYLRAAPRQIGFEFLKAMQPDAFTLTSDGGGEGYGRAIQVQKVIHEHAWIAAVARTKEPAQRRFTPEWDAPARKWVIFLCPAFEIRVSDRSAIASGSEGIYRYRRGDEIVYIGRGEIRSRASAPERHEWDFETIEYSLVSNDGEAEKWEGYWLDAYVQEHGRLPFYNRIRGRSSPMP